MNILCDLISARQGFNKQQENFPPSIPSSLSLALYIFPQITGNTKSSAWWRHSDGSCDRERQCAKAQIQSGGLGCPLGAHMMQLTGSIKA